MTPHRASLPRAARARLAAVAAAAVVCGGVAVPAAGSTLTGTHGAPTVVAVVEPGGFSPYHYDFLATQHPWYGTPDEIDLTADPATYVTGYPASTPLNITTASSPTDSVAALRAADAAVWSTFQQSTLASVTLHRFPGTKIVGAVAFGPSFYADNSSHGTRSAASAVGNIHGTCPECLVVLVSGTTGLAWAQSQSWIDVVTNSWTASKIWKQLPEVPNVGRPRVDSGIQSGIRTSLAAANRGQSVVFSSGNGVLNTGDDVPQLTYVSGLTGPDWVVTVAGTVRGTPTSGYGKPADIAAEAGSYPSTGTDLANGTGTHSGTSNAAPVVAGRIAKVIQLGRDALADPTGGQSGGVVASGAAVTCGPAAPACPLDDGQLTRVEAENVLFHNVTARPTAGMLRLTGVVAPHSYLAVGHGEVRGVDDPTGMASQQARFRDALIGAVAPLSRPAGERSWMIADSMCRQRIWGAAPGGYWTGSEVDDGSSPFATAWHAWCTQDVADGIRAGISGLPNVQ